MNAASPSNVAAVKHTIDKVDEYVFAPIRQGQDAIVDGYFPRSLRVI